MEMERLPLGQSYSDKQRAAHYKWVNMPSGLTPELASKFMLGLHGGKTIRDMTDAKKEHYICSMERFRKHCALNEEWGAEARKKSWTNFTTKKKVSNVLGQATREVCLKGLHPMTGDNLRIDPSTGRRACLACRYFARDNPPPMTPEVLAEVKQALQAGLSQSAICNGHPVGGGKVDKKLILTSTHKFYNQRRIDPEFDKFVATHIAESGVRGQRARWRRVKTHIRTAAAREEANEFRSILALLPTYILGRDDVAQDIFLAVFDGSLKREDIRKRIKWHIADHNKRFPTKYAKFGDSPLVSLDAVIFDDGTATRGDYVSRGLWD